VVVAEGLLFQVGAAASLCDSFLPEKMGPKRPNKLTEEVCQKLRELAEEGMGLRAIAREAGLDPSTVRSGLGG
jgi:DNA-binding NarL/FixJ family response regulator